jgi:MFS family permease
MAGMLMGAVLVWLALTVWLSFAGLVLMGLAAAPVFPSLIGVTPLRFGSKQAPTIIGFQVGAAALGIAGLPALSGVLAARVGLEVIPLLLVVASAGMVALHEIVLHLARRPLPPQSDDRGEPD